MHIEIYIVGKAHSVKLNTTVSLKINLNKKIVVN